ncbi:MAG: Asp-tRNA(Asn)/Glu-tRNA(Gln) amidotransferase subunit GatB [Gammaproteobacteria bacterium]|nr:Asp-tRNA(Asn)/Glu-tRNA(Gln) amidotransferase subunit GatB [Gammaproteobacteria bacterium]
MATWEPVIGIEVHVQLDTNSKIFSSTPVAFGREPNESANLVDLAMPGSLPVLNEAAVHKAIKFGLAIDAEIAAVCRFDRKNYFYPDLPKGYQISQLEEPIVGKGRLEVLLDSGETLDVGITRAHLEEDAGKSVHDRFQASSGIDLNRAGTPLLEIVTEPDLRSPSQAAACFRQLHALVTCLEICDGNLQEGSMRCDANISVRPAGQEAFGERTEIKNLNSFRFVESALEYEIDRQIHSLENGQQVARETRLYDSQRHETRPMRGKELSDDYRYFPDPDLLPVRISEELVAKIRATLPELPKQKLDRFLSDYQIPMEAAVRLVQDNHAGRYFESAVGDGAAPTLVCNWMLGDIAAMLNKLNTDFAHIEFASNELVTLLARIEDRTISSKIAKNVFSKAYGTGRTVDEIINSEGLVQITDSDKLEEIIKGVLEANPSQVAQFKAGKPQVAGYLVGQTMRETKGKADPKQVNQILQELLSL